MDPQRNSRLALLVAESLRLPPAERDAHLERGAAGDPALLIQARALLHAQVRAQDTVRAAAPTSPPPSAGAEPGEPNLAARRLGDCTLTRRLAGGGMGVVYEAVQDPPGRVVAVKVLRAALAGEEGRLRFAHEARLLARLRHPGIAQIYETGTTTGEAGEELPFFVMEHVAGAQTLLDHAASRRLGTRERLRLFTRVCDAVHFGHTKGVIHRDLKPGNVLVDADGAPKVIDFGIARSTIPETQGHATPHTETGLLVGTLPYMSPEQVSGERSDVDTRSDVYALGVILYELLTGRLPYELEGLGVVEVARAITSKPPLPPARFAPDTAGDLTVILGKALAKDPAQRYASAEALGQDVERYLAFAPIQARPPSIAYQLRLLARRHRAAFAAALTGLAALIGAVVVSAWYATEEAAQRRVAESQRARAEALLAGTRELVPWLLRDFNADLARLPGSVAVRAALAARLREHLDALAVTERDHPAVLDAAIEARTALGEALGAAGASHLGRRPEAVAQFTQALELLARRESQGAGAAWLSVSRADLLLARSSSRKELGDLRGARDDVDAALQALGPRSAAESPDLARRRLEAETRRADLDWAEGRHEPALAAYADVLERWSSPGLAEATEREREAGRALAHLALAQCLLELGRHADAAPHVAAVALVSRDLAARPQLTPAQLHLLYYLDDNVGRGLLEAGRHEQAAERFRSALATAERRVGHDPLDAQARAQAHNAHQLLGRAAFDQGRYPEALEHYGRGLALSETLGVGEPPESNLLWDRRLALTFLGQSHLALGGWAEAEAALRRATVLADARAQSLPEMSSFVGQRDAWGQLSNVDVRRFRTLVSSREAVVRAAQRGEAFGLCFAATSAADLLDGLADAALRRARAHLARARDALARVRDTPQWSDGFAADLANMEANLAAMDAGLAALAR